MFFRSNNSREKSSSEPSSALEASKDTEVLEHSDQVNLPSKVHPDLGSADANVVANIADASAIHSASASLSQEELEKQAANSQKVLAQFGAIVRVLIRAKASRNMTLAQIDNLVVPAVTTGQFVIAEAKSNVNGMVAPVAAVLWATVSDDVDKRLSQDLQNPISLDLKDWRSGANPWLMAAAGDQRLIGGMIDSIQKRALNGRKLKLRSVGKDGAPTVMTVEVGHARK